MLSLPIDVIETILSILPPYPYHFNLRLVSKAMKEIIENYINPNQFLYSHIFSPSKEEFEQILNFYKQKIDLNHVNFVSLPADMEMSQEEFEKILSIFPNCKKLRIPFYENSIAELFEDLQPSDSKIEQISLIGAFDFEVSKYKRISMLKIYFPELKNVEITYHQVGKNYKPAFYQYRKLRNLTLEDAIYLTESGINVNMPIPDSRQDDVSFTLLDIACGRWDSGNLSVVSKLNFSN